MDYSHILGQENSVRYLKKTVAKNRHSHAVIFEGEDGTGKMTLAKVYAKSLLCTGGDKPCGNCAACAKFDHGSHMDFKILGPGSRKSISTEDVSDLLSDAYLIPGEGQNKVYIIEHAQLMTPAAQNKLLKILEEPPQYLSIILLCDNIANVLPTIISRSMTIKMQRLTDDIIKGEMMKMGADEKRAGEIAAFSGGNLGYAINILGDKNALKKNEEYYEAFFGIDKSRIDAFSYLGKKRDEISEILVCWQKILSDCLKIKTGAGSGTHDEYKRNYVKKHEINDIIDKLTYILKAESRLAGNAQYLPTVDWLLSNL